MFKQTHTILVVDDDPMNLLILEKVLRPKYEVVTAGSGEEAIKVLMREEISLLISDQRMPGMSGTELLRESQLLRPDMVLMLLTSNNDTETFIDAVVKSGALRVITKPWDAGDLLSVVEASLQRYESLLDRKGSIDRLKRMKEKLDRIANPQ
jgi:response regulator RpfG family c-di-GMP phosphodiesterase